VKYCPGCDQDLPDEAFYRHAVRGTQALCGSCARDRRRDHYVENRGRTRAANTARDARYRAQAEEYLWGYLSAHPCVDCGEADPLVLQFDHVRGVKRRDIAAMLGTYPLPGIIAEVAKCEVRCARCHRRVTAVRGRHWKAVALGLCP